MFEWPELADLHQTAAVAAKFDADALSDAGLCEAAVGLAAVRAAVDAAEAHVLAVLDRREVCDREFGLSTVSWIADRTRIPRSVAAGRVKTARKLRDHLAEVDAALGDGRISFDHAKALADVANPRVVDGVAQLQGPLLDAAEHAPFAVWRSELAGIVDRLDQDGGHDPTQDLARNQLHLNAVGADTTIVSGELCGDTALVIGHAIDREADRLWRQLARDHDTTPDLPLPPRATLRALGLADLCRRALAADPDAGAAPVADVTLVVRAEHPEEVFTEDGAHLPFERVAHLVCDPVFHRLITGHHDRPVAVDTRPQRLANRQQRRALDVRDGGCVFPGCDRPASWCDAHHIVPWQKGGPTVLDNLALLCRRHHGVTHRTGWTMQAEPDGTFAWITPSGQTLRSRRRTQPAA